MSGLFKALVLGICGGLLGALCSMTPWISHLEEDIGLTWLFHHRGAQTPPADVVVIAIDKDSANHLQLTEGPREWPRRLHTRLLQKLSAAGASVIAFDILFKKHRDQEDDMALSLAMSAAGNVVLFEGLARDSIATTDSSGIVADVLIEKMVQPLPEFSQAAVALAPFPLPKVPVRVSQFWKFSPDAADAPTLPVAAYQFYVLEVYTDFLSLLQKINPLYAVQLPQTRDAIIHDMGLVKFIKQLRFLFNKDKGLSDAMLQLLNEDAVTHDPKRKEMLQSFIGIYQNGQSQYLNYYGPARTINTIPYYKLLSDDNVNKGESDKYDFHNKFVFVGSSEIKQWEQHDGFYSVYSNPDTGLDISGVEIAATAVANLLEDSAVRPLTPVTHFLLVLAWGLCLGMLCRLLSAGWATLGMIGICVGYYWLVSYQFAAAGMWLPTVMPLLIQAPVILFAGVLWTYLDTHRERRNIQNAFGYYLPPKIVDRLIKEGPEFGKGGHLVYGICLYTDAEQYTRLAEHMEPKALGALMNAYYHAIFEPVRRHDGTVSDVVGDSMLAIWTGLQPSSELRTLACHAALELIQAQDQFNSVKQEHRLPTRVGLHCGNMLLGHVGAIDHYEYRAVGDIVNTATRIQGVNKFFGTRLLVSAETLMGVDGLVTRELGNFVLVGKSQPVRLFELFCRQEDANASLLNLCNEFMHALDKFRAQRWDEAAREFTNLYETHDQDPPSHYYQKLCALYHDTPPAPNWDGVITLQSK